MKIWVVTNGRGMQQPEMADICHLSSIRSIMLQTLGGLKPEDVIATFHEHQEKEAKAHAERVLEVNSQLRNLDRMPRDE